MSLWKKYHEIRQNINIASCKTVGNKCYYLYKEKHKTHFNVYLYII